MRGGFYTFHVRSSAAALLPLAARRATVSLLLFDCLPKIKSGRWERVSGEMREKEQFDWSPINTHGITLGVWFYLWAASALLRRMRCRPLPRLTYTPAGIAIGRTHAQLQKRQSTSKIRHSQTIAWWFLNQSTRKTKQKNTKKYLLPLSWKYHLKKAGFKYFCCVQKIETVSYIFCKLEKRFLLDLDSYVEK